MGLQQKFKFKYEDPTEVIGFIESFSEKYQIKNQTNGLYIIKNKSNVNFIFSLAIEDYGLSTDRTGEYYQFLGLFIEALTGKFGILEIDDI